MLASLLTWLRSETGTLAVGAVVYGAVVVIARYAPANSPFWTLVRSYLTDYAHKNLKTIPGSAAVRVELAPFGGFDVVITLGDEVLMRRHVETVDRSSSPVEAASALKWTPEAHAERVASEVNAKGGKS